MVLSMTPIEIEDSKQRKVDLTYRGVSQKKELTSVKMIETLEILVASAIFLTIINAEIQFLYGK